VRYAQSRGLSLKVSDEFTVPLCTIHHHDIHTAGNERDESAAGPERGEQKNWPD